MAPTYTSSSSDNTPRYVSRILPETELHEGVADGEYVDGSGARLYNAEHETMPNFAVPEATAPARNVSPGKTYMGPLY